MARSFGVVGITFILFLTHGSVFAGKVELTTYFPATQGDYKELKARGNSSFATTNQTKVGIGTESPVSKFHVMGGIRSKRGLPDPGAIPPDEGVEPNSDYSDVGYSFDNDGDTGMFRTASTDVNASYGFADLVFPVDNIEMLRMTNSFVVGIHQPSPEGSKPNPFGGDRSIYLDVDESIIVDDIYLRQPTYASNSPRWLSDKTWAQGEHCGLFTRNAANGHNVNVPCQGHYIYSGGDLDNSSNFSCPSGFQRAGGDFQSSGNRYWWTCVKT